MFVIFITFNRDLETEEDTRHSEEVSPASMWLSDRDCGSKLYWITKQETKEDTQHKEETRFFRTSDRDC